MSKVLLFCLLTLTLYAQSYEEFKQSQQQAFSSYKEARDKEFSEFLNKEWKSFKASQGALGYEKHKPLVLPKAPKVKQKAKEATEVTLKKNKQLLIETTSIEKVVPKGRKKIMIASSSDAYKTLYINYFGVEVELHYDKSILFGMKRSVSKEDITSAWKKLAKSEYEVSIKELNRISKELELNAWGEYLLIQKVSKALFSASNEEKLFTWFVLLKMGYDAHIAYQSHKLIVLLPVKGQLYNTVFYTLNTRKYYAIEYYAQGKIGSVLSYENSYKGATKVLDFSLQRLPLLAQDKKEKHFSFQLNNTRKELTLSYNKNLFEFFNSYPQVSYRTYFASPESILLDNSVKEAFNPILQGKRQSEALDIILNFVQNAFAYQVDDEQFNREKVMFPSETLFYPYSDCEDRAILFTYMVKVLLGLDVIGVKYPNHMATAVKIQEKIKGEYIGLKGKQYVVADPSYINATVGMSMPEFRGSKRYSIVSTGGEK